MDILIIPFVEKVGIQKRYDGILQLEVDRGVQNHLQSIHAGAQFTLAETASGAFLQTLFPDVASNVIPVLRGSQIKYKKPALKKLSAFASVIHETIEPFKQQLTQKGRALISVHVVLKDEDDLITCEGEFDWFIQMIKE